MLTHGDTDRPPEYVMNLIRDQYAAIEGLYSFVTSQRLLTKSYIRELHQALTARQDWIEARDSLGQSVRRPLLRGQWKQWPNNIEFTGGTFEFCPPEHVESEMERLIAIHEQHVQNQVPPEVSAAWLHHRFTLIHPFQDGNGRIARCLATLVFLKARWFPLVVTRADRARYLAALRDADNGNLKPLVSVFGSLQRKAIREALSLSDQVEAAGRRAEDVLVGLRQKFESRKRDLDAQRRRVFGVADTLQAIALDRLRDLATEVGRIIKEADPDYYANAFGGAASEDKSKYNRYQVIQAAKHLKYFASPETYHSWAKIQVRTDKVVELFVSLHGMGRDSRGVVAATAMIYPRERIGEDEEKTVVGDVLPLWGEPFEFTYREDASGVRRRFTEWLDSVLSLGAQKLIDLL